jgi:hypothetical protein
MTDTIAHFSLWRRAVVWLAVAGLLGDIALPAAAISIAVGSAGLGICKAASAGDLPGKAKPGLLVHYCSLCAAPATLPHRPPPSSLAPNASAEEAHLQLGTVSLVALLRHGPVQARAPPLVA